MASNLDEVTELRACTSLRERGQLLARLFMAQRKRLDTMVRLRLDPRLRARVDPSDILQETFLEAARRIESFIERPSMPFFLWLRHLALQRLLQLHRFHLGSKRREAQREVPLYRTVGPDSSSDLLAAGLLTKDRTPSGIAMQAEAKEQIEGAIDRLLPQDREILALRHFEQLSTAEAAAILCIAEPAARKRYLRAIERLRVLLTERSGGAEPR